MSNPVTVSCTADTWVKVATNVTAGYVWVVDNPVQLLQTYRPHLGAAPTLSTEGVKLKQPGEEISSLEGIDVYIYSKDKTGKVRVDL